VLRAVTLVGAMWDSLSLSRRLPARAPGLVGAMWDSHSTQPISKKTGERASALSRHPRGGIDILALNSAEDCLPGLPGSWGRCGIRSQLSRYIKKQAKEPVLRAVTLVGASNRTHSTQPIYKNPAMPCGARIKKPCLGKVVSSRRFCATNVFSIRRKRDGKGGLRTCRRSPDSINLLWV